MTIAEALTDSPPPVRLGEDGALRVGTTRVLLDLVVDRYRQGEDALGIVDSFPSLTLAQAHSAIAFYLSHTAEVDQYMAERERQGEDVRRQIEAEYPTTDLRRRILSIREAQQREDDGLSRG